MNEKIKKTLFPNICISFTLTILILSAGQIISGLQACFRQGESLPMGFPLFACELFLLLCLVTAFCTWVEKLRFKHKITYPVLELLINYIVFLGGSYVCRWIKFDTKNIAEIALILILVTLLYLNLYISSQKKCKKEADKINRLLKKRGN